MSSRKIKPKERICPVCKVIFLVGGRGRKPYKAIYCSLKCKDKAQYHKGVKCNILTETQAAYIAGFLDGEGSIIIVHKKPTRYSLRVSISQSARARQVLDWISEVTGIGASINKNPTKGENHAVGLTWVCNSYAAETLLAQLFPYLIVKRQQAELAIDFHNKLQETALRADKQWQAEYKEKMGVLNKRGR